MDKKEIVEKMIKNTQQAILDDEVKIEFYEFLATQCEDEKRAASWRVEADKTKMNMKGLQEAYDNLTKFALTY